MRRGELSMTVIIGAAIALLILVIISVLVLNSMNQVGTGTSCAGLEGAVCVVLQQGVGLQQGETCGDYIPGYIRGQRSCVTSAETCCMPGPGVR